jgi:hypothetical protein
MDCDGTEQPLTWPPLDIYMDSLFQHFVYRNWAIDKRAAEERAMAAMKYATVGGCGGCGSGDDTIDLFRFDVTIQWTETYFINVRISVLSKNEYYCRYVHVIEDDHIDEECVYMTAAPASTSAAAAGISGSSSSSSYYLVQRRGDIYATTRRKLYPELL